METTLNTNFGAAVLAACAEYYNTIKRPVSNVQISPGVNHVMFEKEYHAASTVSTSSSDTRPPVNMVKRFVFKTYSNGRAYVEYFVHLEHDGYILYDHDVDKGIMIIVWSPSDSKATSAVVGKVMALLRKSDARLEMINAVIAGYNDSQRKKADKIRGEIFHNAAMAWREPLPENAKGTFNLPWNASK